MHRCVILDYGSGNLLSAAKAFERAARAVDVDLSITVTHDIATVAAADRLVLPGVGAFADCKRGLAAVPGLIETLDHAVHSRAVPFLGICVGMQLLADTGFEFADATPTGTPGLGWIKGEVVHLAAPPPLKIPHMGWNNLTVRAPDHPLVRGLGADDHVYFVHSYRFVCQNPHDIVADVAYGEPIPALIAHDNIAGTQFHPEKSQAAGLALLANFLKWRP